jgi:superfamily II DNA or RNA helicase
VSGWNLRFESGSLVIDGIDQDLGAELGLESLAVFDERIGLWRAVAFQYRELFGELFRQARQRGVELEDHGRCYEEIAPERRHWRAPRPYQTEALQAWKTSGRRGVVVLPTGAGKSHVAHMAMEQVGRSCLIVVPTIDLMHQWYSGFLDSYTLDEVGLLGGGYHELKPITVTTYDSAAIHMERYGDRFGLVVFDEVHHLPGPTYQQAARMMVAPFRLGLTATPERQDGRHHVLDEVVGPIVYRRDIKDLAGEFLADYDVERLEVGLTEAELARYDEARGTYLSFIRRAGIRFDGPGGWGDFIKRSSQSADGRAAMRAYREQKRISLTCEAKLELVERLAARHADDRMIVFTADNETVYALSRQLLLPVITHQTPTKERREVLEEFRSGKYRVVVTSKVLNEGVDVPEANVAVVLSGSGSVREHVQRLGRILRKQGDKRALLYEVITRNTAEEGTSERRREHDAYR